MSTVKAVEIQ